MKYKKDAFFQYSVKEERVCNSKYVPLQLFNDLYTAHYVVVDTKWIPHENIYITPSISDIL